MTLAITASAVLHESGHRHHAEQAAPYHKHHHGGWGRHSDWSPPWDYPSSPVGSHITTPTQPSQAEASSSAQQPATPSVRPHSSSPESSALSEAPSRSTKPKSHSPSSKPSGISGGGDNSGYGLSYAPYNADGTCKTADQIQKDLDAFSGYTTLRIYGTDCDQVANVLPVTSAKNMKLFAGIWDVAEVANEAQLIIDAAKGNWGAIDTISVGNEVVNSGTGTVDQVVSAVKQAKSLLSTAGYTGDVVTVDTWNQIADHPALCQVSDYAAANCHAFFDPDISATNAGSYVKQQARRVQEACGGKRTVITESGWPWKGESNGAAVPSMANHKVAIASLRAAFTSNLVLFSAFNDAWKQDFDGSFGAEKYWGIYGNPPSD